MISVCTTIAYADLRHFFPAKAKVKVDSGVHREFRLVEEGKKRFEGFKSRYVAPMFEKRGLPNPSASSPDPLEGNKVVAFTAFTAFLKHPGRALTEEVQKLKLRSRPPTVRSAFEGQWKLVQDADPESELNFWRAEKGEIAASPGTKSAWGRWRQRFQRIEIKGDDVAIVHHSTAYKETVHRDRRTHHSFWFPFSDNYELEAEEFDLENGRLVVNKYRNGRYCSKQERVMLGDKRMEVTMRNAGGEFRRVWEKTA
uniref:Uncharacterized protein n=1 Tax=Chromera velia CCMP2878 TaxID=1169474 RepID=A0A0G4G613_9ALVE|eukprot:Cvel_20342.t1-p1 / transcript=Cvel_20342.t1 / gene=Cvel_20342 / organism=Chromera_velia_CCMP2878 / gene_product=hypothetical protein / transcript_product=hypothetical protein / location=Cvel_scaffold1818:23081-25469(-) / protein_length=254 / sequence_SO=supercontig / SO=protein_coding / is_pseudo=false